MSFKKSNQLKMAAFLLVSCLSAVASAQSYSDAAGVIRISDGKVSNPRVQQVSSSQVVPATPVAPATAAAVGGGSCPPGGGMYGGCPTGACPTGCPTGCPRCRCLCEHYCKHSPDYGYSPPAKWPLERRGVEYTNYYPQRWYGAGADYSAARFPMVYQPTDTTQLGFYYQHVPSWQPMGNMLPARPVPSQWHIVAPPVEASCYRGGCFPAWGWNYYGWRRCYCPRGGYGYGPGVNYTDASGMPVPAGSGASPTPINSVQPPAGGPGVAPMPINQESPAPLPSDDEQDSDDTAMAPPAPSSAAPTPGFPLQRVPVRPDSASSQHIRRLVNNGE